MINNKFLSDWIRGNFFLCISWRKVLGCFANATNEEREQWDRYRDRLSGGGRGPGEASYTSFGRRDKSTGESDGGLFGFALASPSLI